MSVSTITPEEVLEQTLDAGAQIRSESEEFSEAEFVYGGSVWTFDPESPYGPWKVFRGYLAFHPSWLPGLADTVDCIEQTRQYAESLVNRFPLTIDHLSRLGAEHAEVVLTRPIRRLDDAVLWIYSIWNAALPVAPGLPLGTFPRQELLTTGFRNLQRDVDGYVVVTPDDDHRGTFVFWASPGSQYSAGQYLGPRHPVTLAAYGRGRRKK